ncbi:UNVERIFIED_CONTAM: Transposon Ty3-G Gag-Pol polyprotein [Sesamum calycinum]|uniref:Transposon Ty3-G Gag-Pol polyprotein n=1 Tax=Sesamum calycinum TaxID=2727403 RepID=A0AAW2PBA9_9LAMI
MDVTTTSSNYISNDAKEDIAQTYHITLIEDGEVEEEEAEDAPTELEEGIKATIDELKEVKKGARPVKQSQRRFRPESIPLIEGEVNKLIEVGFIRAVKYPMWISSIVLVRKKNGQIRVCVDFRNLNNACPKDDFPLQITELMIDATTGHEALSFMDGSSGYNQIRMAPVDEELTAFRTPKGRPLILYVAAQERFVGILLAQKNNEEKENALYYLSRMMTPNELKYSPIEKLCLSLIFSIQKLKHYFQSCSIHLVSKANPLKYLMAKPILLDRLARRDNEKVQAMEEAHFGVCGAHQSGPKLHFRIKRMGYYWPTMVKDCIDYARRCQACQFHANLIHQPPEPLHPTVASWPFDAWGLDIVGSLTKSSGGHLYILVAIDYFSKWAEAVPLKELKKENVADFIRTTSFIVMECLAFNKALCNVLKKVVAKSKCDWHESIGEALCAYRTTIRTPTQATLYTLVYGVEAVLPLEQQIPSLRIAIQ